MNNRFLRKLLYLCLMLLAYQARAQQTISVSGKVTNPTSGRPVRGVSITIDKKGVGTATNTAGKFVLLIPIANLKDSLKISCIGYQSKSLPIAGMKDGDGLNITLEKNNKQLDEVTIAYYDANKIIQKAIDRIPENYINHPHILRGFYRMYTYNNDVPLQLSEAVFDVYNFGYADTRADVFKLIKARNEKNDRDFSQLEFGQKPNTIFEEDIVNHLHACGFLNEEGLKKHQYYATGIVDVKGYKAYEIEFKEKSDQEDKTYRGKMYIDTKTYAFIYFDFGANIESLQDITTGNFAGKSLMRTGDASFGLLYDNSKVSYQEVGNKWVLSGVEGEDSLTVRGSQYYVAHIKYNYQITSVDTTQKESFDSKMGRNDNINAYKSNGDEKFWKDYNILLSDYDTESIFKQLQEIDKLVKARGK